jgi:hypothetical protein
MDLMAGDGLRNVSERKARRFPLARLSNILSTTSVVPAAVSNKPMSIRKERLSANAPRCSSLAPAH